MVVGGPGDAAQPGGGVHGQVGVGVADGGYLGEGVLLELFEEAGADGAEADAEAGGTGLEDSPFLTDWGVEDGALGFVPGVC